MERSADGACRVLSNEVRTDVTEHLAFGGVVPEVAARAHVVIIDRIIQQSIEKSGHTYAELDAVAVTAGPGLIGGVMVALTTAKALAIAHEKPLIPVNHLEGHALSVRMTEAVGFPFLLLLISGGHTQLALIESVGNYRRLGTTIDDAAGEAFDKTAKLMGLGQPGGPRLEAAAKAGRPHRFELPLPLVRREGCDFSLSGLKTALRLTAESILDPTPQDVADLAASFQWAVARHLSQQTARAMDRVEIECGQAPTLVAAGGVAANSAIRGRLSDLAQSRNWRLFVPPTKYCTDNGAMIAWAGAERLAAGIAPPSRSVALGLSPRARWPLARSAGGAAFGGGKKGPKA